MKSLIVLISLALVVPATAAKRPHVVIRKPLPPIVRPVPATPVTVAFIVAPPLLVFYDLERRISCAGVVDTLGLGGPGFDGAPVSPAAGNVMIPCWQRRQGQAIPK